MSNWNLPTATSGYLDFVTEMNDKFIDAATLQFGSPINLPESTIRYNRSINLFQEWVAGNWVNKVLSIAGGGTGSTTSAGIISNLGLGSMATQNNNAVNITGGSITGVNFDAGSITGGILSLARGGTGSSLVIPPYGWLMISNGAGNMVMDPGTAILQIDAARIVQGIIPDARLSANVAFRNQNNIFNGTNTFLGASSIFTSFGAGPDNFAIRSVYPLINFNATDAPAGQKNLRIIYTGGYLHFQIFNDDSTVATDALQVGYNGQVICYGGFITGLNANNINAGTVPIANLGAGGSRDSSTFLRGDNTWAVPPIGGGGTAIPAGMVAMFDTNCPAGWTRFSQLDGKFPAGSSSPGLTGGSNSHSHSLTGNTDNQGGHTHSVDAVISGSGHGTVDRFTEAPSAQDSNLNYDSGGSVRTMVAPNHSHHMAFPIDVTVTGSASGNTNTSGAHTHNLNGGTNDVNHLPSYYTLVFCRKD